MKGIKQFPRVMLVWNTYEDKSVRRLVYADLSNVKEYIGGYPIRVIGEDGSSCGFMKSKEINKED